MPPDDSDRPKYRRVNVVLTGLPRSGTTLACRLLNKLPDTVALHEPLSPGAFVGKDAPGELDKFFRRTRRMIRKEGKAPSKSVDGEIPGNAYEEVAPSGGGPRSHSSKKEAMRSYLVVSKELKGGFSLVAKQPGLFSALLPALVGRFPCYAIVRNPLAVLASWNSVDHNVREGHSRGAELYDEELRRELASIDDRVGRQLRLLSWWYERLDTLPRENILRYEALVASGGKALGTIVTSAKDLDEPLESRNQNPLYGREAMLRLGDRLLASEGGFWRFYPRRSVEELLAAAQEDVWRPSRS